MEWDTFALTTAVIPVVFFASSTYIPGIMRKIQARIQLRIGPPILTPGFWAIFKFIYKERITPVSPMPRLYHVLPVIGIFLMFFILLLTTPAWSGVLGLATLVAIAGLVKVEEALYIFMGNLSQSILSVRMPYPDRIKGAIMKGATRRSFEQVAALRTFKLISIGSFPLYLGMFVPAVMAGSISIMSVAAYQGFDTAAFGIRDIFSLSPLLFTAPGLVGALAYVAGYLVVLNEYPFSIMHTKADVIEGPSLEYAARARAAYYLMKEATLIVMSSIFVTLYIGLPPVVGWALVPHLLLCLALPVAAAIISAFTPVLTFKQVYPLSLGCTALGVVGVILAIL